MTASNDSTPPATPQTSLAEALRNQTVVSDAADSADSADSAVAEASAVIPSEPEEPEILPEPKKDALGRAYGTGRRKESVGRVWIKLGTGKVTINGKPFEKHFPRSTPRFHAMGPLRVTERLGQFDVMATVRGGGVSGQAGAIRHGLARALRDFEPGLKRTLRATGMLTRDARVVERKKYGHHKARRSPQFSKR